MENSTEKPKDTIRAAENCITPNSRDLVFKHMELQDLFEEFCNTTYFFNASFFQSESEYEAAKEMSIAKLSKLNTHPELGSIFIRMNSYYNSLYNLRARLLEYNSTPRISFSTRALQRDHMIGWIEDLNNDYRSMKTYLDEKGWADDTEVLRNHLKMLAHKWKPERNFVSAEGGTWKDFFRSITSLDPVYAFQKKRNKRSKEA